MNSKIKNTGLPIFNLLSLVSCLALEIGSRERH
jgi:hypothetical protein